MGQCREELVFTPIELLQSLLRLVDLGNIRRAADESEHIAGIIDNRIAARFEPTPLAVETAQAQTPMKGLALAQSCLEGGNIAIALVGMNALYPIEVFHLVRRDGYVAAFQTALRQGQT